MNTLITRPKSDVHAVDVRLCDPYPFVMGYLLALGCFLLFTGPLRSPSLCMVVVGAMVYHCLMPRMFTPSVERQPCVRRIMNELLQSEWGVDPTRDRLE